MDDSKMKKQEKETVRPLARVLARDLTTAEIAQVAAAGCWTEEGGLPSTGGNGFDCTTGGGFNDRDELQ